jgi:hypothetical protein
MIWLRRVGRFGQLSDGSAPPTVLTYAVGLLRSYGSVGQFGRFPCFFCSKRKKREIRVRLSEPSELSARVSRMVLSVCRERPQLPGKSL